MTRGRTRPWLATGLALLVAMAVGSSLVAQSPLEKGFLDPPPDTKPWVYWYWASDRISREGITRDLEAMAKVGIGEALIGNVLLLGVPRGPVKALTEEWWSLVEHAIREGGRLGVDLGVFNCPGWSQSGGPWVKPGQSMRYLWTAEWRARGPAKLEAAVKHPDGFQHVATIAFPAPTGELEVREFAMTPRADAGKLVYELDFPDPFVAGSLSIKPGPKAFKAWCQIAATDSKGDVSNGGFEVDRRQAEGVAQIGPMRRGEIVIPLGSIALRRLKLEVTAEVGVADFASISVTTAARLGRYVEKQLGIMHQDPLPPWDAYSWGPVGTASRPIPTGDAQSTTKPATVFDLRDAVDANGVVQWDVPSGDWIVVQTGMVPTGARNAPAAEEACGLEVDKMSRAAVSAHFDAYVGKLLDRMPAADRKALKHVVADSWEAGPQNWTDGFLAQFKERYGYDPLPFLPVFTGRSTISTSASNRFLWDLRRLVADRIASDYAGGLKEACNRHGLKLWLQNYGHWGFPAEFLQYGGRADAVAGEFWAGLPYGPMEMRAASSTAHAHGMRVVSAEAFTGGRPFQETPWSLKRLGDRALANGINHFALHLFFHQPNEERPGVNAWFGTEFNRHNTWFPHMGSWLDCWRSCFFLLQQGRPVADVAVFIGEDAPKMTGPPKPEVPPGYDFDWIDAETLLTRVRVDNGRLVVPGGASWRVLALPPGPRGWGSIDIRPELLRKIRDLVEQGAAVAVPSFGFRASPSLEGWPDCDERVKALSDELRAGLENFPQPGASRFQVRRKTLGKGDVFVGEPLEKVLTDVGVPPDVDGVDPKTILWTHRATADADLYFLSNQSDAPVSIAPAFRVTGRVPEIWRPDRRTTERTATFAPGERSTRVSVDLDAGGSCFVVFREAAGSAPAITEVRQAGRVVLSTAPRLLPSAGEADKATVSFAIAFWALPGADITLPPEADSGVATPASRNDAIFPFHGGVVFGSDSQACAGVSIGRNGVVVYEHSAAYFAPILAHEAPITAWTHVAVVYSGNKPALYLNGTLAREGLQSRREVHPSPDATDPEVQRVVAAAKIEVGKPFAGEIREIQRFGRMLSPTEVAGLAHVPFAIGAARPQVILTRAADGGVEAELSAGGAYRGTLADGRVLDLPVPVLPAALALDGAWEVRFPPAMDVPESLTLDRLISWTQHPNEAVRCFSGTATYAKSFELPADWLADGRRVLLDLGAVESLAEIVVNGRRLPTLWKPPFVADVTEALRAGANSLGVAVTNTWWNRLLGDQVRPNGFTGAGPLQFKPRLAFDDSRRLTGDLVPSGLMGPVQLHPTQRIRIPFR
jgi:alpha-L-rhamnosidase/Concanavalin A-like lectin/glucanases superfamily/Glycosyl hydrolases family 2, sugar binding domain